MLPSLAAPPTRVSIEAKQLEHRVEAVEHDIGILKGDSAVTLKLLSLSLAGKELTEEDIANVTTK